VFVRTGQVRVELLSTTGQQLLLYRIYGGQSCVMTTACLLGESQYHAQAITETPVELILMPQTVFRANLAESPDFRNFVFNGFSDRLAALLQRTTELATYSVDQRLASALLQHADTTENEGRITLTHEQLAVEIGTAREVISRRLAAFEKKGIIIRHRGYIDIQLPAVLKEHLIDG